MNVTKIREIPISEIDDFPDHPYRVVDDGDMEQLVESILLNGLITPALVRRKGNGRYEMISGHRRKRAASKAGLKTLRCEVIDVTHAEAVVMMVDANVQRPNLLPSEKAFAYKMRMEALKHQGKRTDMTLDPMEPKFMKSHAVDKLSEQTNESATQIKRYIRLTCLIPELLRLVDNSVLKEKNTLRMGMRPAVELSFLPESMQRDLWETIQLYQCTPSHAQTIEMRKCMEEGILDREGIEIIMREDKPNQKERFILHSERVSHLIPGYVPMGKREDYIIRALEHYAPIERRKREKAVRAKEER